MSEPDTGRSWGPVVAVPFGPAAAGLVKILTGAAILTGIAFAETAGVAGAFDILDGADAGGVLLCPVTFAANGSNLLSMGLAGVDVQRGIAINVTGGGTVKGAVYLIRA